MKSIEEQNSNFLFKFMGRVLSVLLLAGWLVGCLASTKGESMERREYGNNEFNAVGIVFVFSDSSKQAIHHFKIEKPKILSWTIEWRTDDDVV